jgi:hypothetical protein
MIEQAAVVVPGDPGYHGTCITADTRSHPSHCWERAAIHCFHMEKIPFFTKMEAATTCMQMVDAILKLRIPPQKSPVQWGWGKGWPGQ